MLCLETVRHDNRLTHRASLLGETFCFVSLTNRKCMGGNKERRQGRCKKGNNFGNTGLGMYKV